MKNVPKLLWALIALSIFESALNSISIYSKKELNERLDAVTKTHEKIKAENIAVKQENDSLKTVIHTFEAKEAKYYGHTDPGVLNYQKMKDGQFGTTTKAK